MQSEAELNQETGMTRKQENLQSIVSGSSMSEKIDENLVAFNLLNLFLKHGGDENWNSRDSTDAEVLSFRNMLRGRLNKGWKFHSLIGLVIGVPSVYYSWSSNISETGFLSYLFLGLMFLVLFSIQYLVFILFVRDRTISNVFKLVSKLSPIHYNVLKDLGIDVCLPISKNLDNIDDFVLWVNALYARSRERNEEFSKIAARVKQGEDIKQIPFKNYSESMKQGRVPVIREHIGRILDDLRTALFNLEVKLKKRKGELSIGEVESLDKEIIYELYGVLQRVKRLMHFESGYLDSLYRGVYKSIIESKDKGIDKASVAEDMKNRVKRSNERLLSIIANNE